MVVKKINRLRKSSWQGRCAGAGLRINVEPILLGRKLYQLLRFLQGWLSQNSIKQLKKENENP